MKRFKKILNCDEEQREGRGIFEREGNLYENVLVFQDKNKTLNENNIKKRERI